MSFLGSMGSGAGQSLVNSGAWSDLQNQMANYVYDPNDPNKWQQLVDQAANYQGQTANVGSAGSGGIGNALKALGSGKGSDNVSPPPAVMGSMPSLASSSPHAGSPASGLTTNLNNLTEWRKFKGLLGI